MWRGSSIFLIPLVFIFLLVFFANWRFPNFKQPLLVIRITNAPGAPDLVPRSLPWCILIPQLYTFYPGFIFHPGKRGGIEKQSLFLRESGS